MRWWLEAVSERLKVQRWFVALAFAGLALRYLLLWQYRLSPFQWGLTLDDWKYWNHASEIARGGWLPTEVFAQGPLYPYLLAFLRTIFPSFSVQAVSALQLFLNWITCLLLYPLAGKVAGQRAALIASSIGLFFAPAVFFSLKVLAITVGLFLLVSGILILIQGEGWKAFAAAGVIFGLAALATPSVMPTAAAAAAVAALSSSGIRRLSAPAVFLLGFFLSILPVTLSNYFQDGSRVLISSNYGVNFYIGNNPDAGGLASVVEGISTDVTGQEKSSIALARRETGRILNKGEVARYFFRKGLAFIVEHPASYLRLMARKTVLLLSGVDFSNEFSLVRERRDYLSLIRLFPLAGTAVLLLAAVALTGKGVLRKLWIYLLLALSQGAVSLVYFNANRHVLAFQFLLIPVAAAGLSLGRRGLRPLFAAMAAAVILVSALYAGLEARSPYNEAFYRTSVMMAFNDAGRFEETVSAFEKVAGKLTPSPSMFQMAAHAYSMTGEEQAAEKLHRRALDLYPDEREVVLDAAGFLGSTGKVPEALDLYRKWLLSHPEDVEARVLTAKLLVGAGRDAEAEEEVRKALSGNPFSADAHFLLGVLSLRRGETEKGIGKIERAIEINPRLPAEAYYFLAMAYLKSGRREKARENLLRAGSLGYPVPEEARRKVSGSTKQQGQER